MLPIKAFAATLAACLTVIVLIIAAVLRKGVTQPNAAAGLLGMLTVTIPTIVGITTWVVTG